MCPVLEPLSGHQAGFVTQTTRKFKGTLASLPFNVTGFDPPGADAAQMLTKPMAGKRVRAIELGIETLTSQGCKHACCCAFNLVVPLTQALGGLEEIHRVLNVKLPLKCKCGSLLLWPLGIPVVVYAGIRTLCHLRSNLQAVCRERHAAGRHAMSCSWVARTGHCLAPGWKIPRWNLPPQNLCNLSSATCFSSGGSALPARVQACWTFSAQHALPTSPTAAPEISDTP